MKNMKALALIAIAAFAFANVAEAKSWAAEEAELEQEIAESEEFAEKFFAEETSEMEVELIEEDIEADEEATERDPSSNQCSTSCDDLTREQEDCVIKKRCNKELGKLLKKIRELEEENEDLKQKNAALEAESKLEQELARIKQIEKQEPNKNSISLLYGRSGTGVKVKQTAGSFKAESDVEDDIGLQYQRDFGDELDYLFSIGLTVRGNGYVGLGLNF